MGANEQLRIETQKRADRLILELHGELDMATSPQLAEALEELAQKWAHDGSSSTYVGSAFSTQPV